MYHIFVDLEMQQVERRYREVAKGCRTETIEIGAVVYDDGFKELASFKSYVKPRYSARIRETIRNLTGITTQMVEQAPDFCEAMQSFMDWCLQYGPEAVFYEWSDTDLLQLRKEMKHKGVELCNAAHELLDKEKWLDAQAAYDKLVETENQVALETALWSIGESFEGKMHDALWDARNTARIYSLMQKQTNVELAKQMLHHGTPESSFTFTLGDMFDFSKLQLAG